MFTPTPDQLSDRTRRPGSLRVAVVGAGIAGLAAARDLLGNVAEVTVLERGRRPGGRCASRRAQEGHFDHGAQFFTARDPALLRAVTSWEQAGLVAAWRPRTVSLPDGEPVRAGAHYVGVPGMSALAGHLARDLPLHVNSAVQAIEHDGARWILHGEAGPLHGEHDALILAMPPEQALRILPDPDPLRATLFAHRSVACWCAMVSFDAPLTLPYDAARVKDDVLMWCARDSSKPGRGPGERWVLHASADWSGEHLLADPADVAEALLERFFDLVGCAPVAPSHLRGHRWGLARCEQPADTACLWDGARRLGIAGDWCISPRLEDAWRSGVAAAARVLAAGDPG